MQLLQSLKAVWYKSWTKSLAYTQAAGAGITMTLSTMNSYVSDPTIKGYIAQLDTPKWVSASLVVLGIVTYIAHGREND